MSIAPSNIEPVNGSDGKPTCIGRGGFGAVFLARLRAPDAGGEDVAVKRVLDLTDPRAAAQFRVEYALHLRLSLRLDGVCRIYGMCEGHPIFDTCFVMRRYKCSLLDEIKSAGGGGIPLLRVLIVLAKVAKTMASLHTAYNLLSRTSSRRTSSSTSTATASSLTLASPASSPRRWAPSA